MTKTLLLAVPLFLLSSTTILAQRPTDVPRGPKIATEAAQRRLENRCQAINSRIKAHLNNYSVRKDNHIAVFRAALERWQQLATRLKDRGLDTTKLEADLVTLDGLIDDLETDYTTFQTDMEQALSIDCDTADTSLKTQLQTGRTKLSEFRTQSKTVRDFIKNTIRADLLALRQAAGKLPEPTVTTTPTP